MHAPTHSLPPIRPPGLRAAARLLAAWAPGAAAVIVAATLGLLAPLSCVIHCAIHRHGAAPQPPAAEAPAHLHHGEGAAPDAGAPAHRPAPGGEEPTAPPTPRALYELLGRVADPLIAAAALLCALGLAPARAPRSRALAPPTPPPRPLCA